METKTKSRLTSYNFWVKLASAVILILRIVLSKFGIEIDSAFILDIATLVAGVLVVLGIINEPTGITISYKNQESEVNGNMENVQNFKTQIEEKLNEVRDVFASFGIEDKEVVNAKLEQINGFLVSLFNAELKSIETLSNMLNEEEGESLGEIVETDSEKQNNLEDSLMPINVNEDALASVTTINASENALEGIETINVGEFDKKTENCQQKVEECNFKVVDTEDVENNERVNVENIENVNCVEVSEDETVEGLGCGETLENGTVGESVGADFSETLLSAEISDGVKNDSGAVQMIKTLENEFCGEDLERQKLFAEKLSTLLEDNLNIFE